MKTRVPLIVIWLELGALTLTPAYATEYRVGVTGGNWAKYVILSSWESTDPSVPMPQYVQDVENTSWIQINVTKISYTTVTILVTTQFKNGSKKSNINIGDVKTGSGNLSLQVVAADLTEGEKLSEAQGALTINKTLVETYANAPRAVNYAYQEESTPVDETGTENGLHEFHWDKSSGIITGISIVRTFESEQYRTITKMGMKITETNIWQPEASPGLSLELIAALAPIAIAIISIVFLSIRKTKKEDRRRRLRTPRHSHGFAGTIFTSQHATPLFIRLQSIFSQKYCCSLMF